MATELDSPTIGRGSDWNAFYAEEPLSFNDPFSPSAFGLLLFGEPDAAGVLGLLGVLGGGSGGLSFADIGGTLSVDQLPPGSVASLDSIGQDALYFFDNSTSLPRLISSADAAAFIATNLSFSQIQGQLSLSQLPPGTAATVDTIGADALFFYDNSTGLPRLIGSAEAAAFIGNNLSFSNIQGTISIDQFPPGTTETLDSIGEDALYFFDNSTGLPRLIGAAEAAAFIGVDLNLTFGDIGGQLSVSQLPPGTAATVDSIGADAIYFFDNTTGLPRLIGSIEAASFLNLTFSDISGQMDFSQFPTGSVATLDSIEEDAFYFFDNAAFVPKLLGKGDTLTFLLPSQTGHDGQFLQTNAGLLSWAAAASGATGSAGGDLGGTYPNPTVLNLSHVNSGILGIANGGTGASSSNFTSGGAVVYNGAALATLGPNSTSTRQFYSSSNGTFTLATAGFSDLTGNIGVSQMNSGTSAGSSTFWRGDGTWASLGIGTNVQAWDADLDALAALSGTNNIYYRSATNTWSSVTIGSGLDFSSGTLATSGLATDSAVVHLAGTETIAGAKTFSVAPVVPNNSFPESAISNLTTDLAAKLASIPVGNTLYVDAVNGHDSGGNAGVRGRADLPFLTISAANAVAQSGDIISVGPGIFTENSNIRLPSGVSLLGAGIGSTTINSDGSTASSAGCIVALGTNSYVANLTINATAASGIPIGGSANDAAFTNAVVYNVKTIADADGAYIRGTGPRSVTFFNCIFSAKYDAVNIWSSAAGTTAEFYDCRVIVAGPSTIDAGAFARGVVGTKTSNGQLLTLLWHGGRITVNGATGSGSTNIGFRGVNQTGFVTEIHNTVTEVGTSATTNYDINTGSYDNVTRADGAALVTTGTLTNLSRFAVRDNNLSDLANVSTARTNLGLVASATTDTTNASNISSGTLAAARLPNPSATTLGGIESLAAASHQWINAISTSGVPSATQPAIADVSDATTVGQNIVKLTNPSAVSFVKIAADNSVSTRTPAQVLADIGAQASGSYAVSGSNSDITALTGLTGASTITRAGIGSTPTDALLLTNTTAAAAGAQQYSGALHFTGQGWKTNSTAASQTVDFRSYVAPVQGAANPTGYLTIESQVNAGGYGNPLNWTTSGLLQFGGTTSSSPALKVSPFGGTRMGVRLADDSDWAQINGAGFEVFKSGSTSVRNVVMATNMGGGIGGMGLSSDFRIIWSSVSSSSDNNIGINGALGLGYSSAGRLQVNSGLTANNWGALDIGTITLKSLSTPAAPTLATAGTAGSTTISYKITDELADGTATDASVVATITTANATLTSTNKVTVTLGTFPSNVTKRRIWRTATNGTAPTTTGSIGTITSGTTFDDTGLAGDSATAPTVNNTGSIVGTINAPAGTITANTPALAITQTWNNSGISFIPLTIAVTDTASAGVGSGFVKFSKGGTDQFSVNKSGICSAIQFSVGSGSMGAGSGVNLVSDRIYVGSGGTLNVGSSGNTNVVILDGTSNRVNTPFRLKGYTVATLPAGTQGDTAFATDLLTPAFLVTAVGGGSSVGPVFYDGTSWKAY